MKWGKFTESEFFWFVVLCSAVITIAWHLCG